MSIPTASRSSLPVSRDQPTLPIAGEAIEKPSDAMISHRRIQSCSRGGEAAGKQESLHLPLEPLASDLFEIKEKTVHQK